jgi:hypothetical protein
MRLVNSITRRLAAARSDRWGAARSLAAARRERWDTVVFRRLKAGRRERRAARVVPRGCTVDGGGGNTAADR